jgi:hypothetical protein
MYTKRYAGSVISDFSTPEGVKRALTSKDKKALAALCGALGAVQKGGKAVGSDDSSSYWAGYYWDVLNGRQKKTLDDEDAEKIAALVAGFLGGPKRMKSVK